MKKEKRTTEITKQVESTIYTAWDGEEFDDEEIRVYFTSIKSKRNA